MKFNHPFFKISTLAFISLFLIITFYACNQAAVDEVIAVEPDFIGPEKGTLIIIGGNARDPLFLEKFKEYSIEILNKNGTEVEQKLDTLKKELEKALEKQSNILGEVKTNVLVLNQITEKNKNKLDELISKSLPESFDRLNNSLLSKLESYELKNSRFRKIIYILAAVTLIGVVFSIILWL